MFLPSFSNDKNENLEKFFHGFESIIKKHNLSDYEMFVYLRGQLCKTPKSLVESLDIEEQQYETAKELLTKAFGSTLSQKYDTIKKLSELQLKIDGDPFEYICSMRTITSSFKNLSIDTNIVLQYFFC